MTKQELHNFAMFVREYCDENITSLTIEQRHGINPDLFNFREAIDAYVRHHKIELEPKRK